MRLALWTRQIPLLLAAACLAPSAAGAKPLVGMLTVDAPTKEQAAALELSLPRAPELAARWLVIGPAELSARLARAASVSARVDAARAHQLRAEQALVQMERKTALTAAASAVAALERVVGRLHVPDDLVRARLVQAQARLLQPADEQAAQRALQAALAINPALKLDPARISPRVAGLLEQARGARSPAARPTRAELKTLARIGALEQLVWIRLRRRAGASGEVLAVELLVYTRGVRALRAQTRELMPSDLSRQLPGLVSAALRQSLPPSTVAAAAAPVEPVSPRQRPGDGSPPWYRRWWVWAAVGVAVVGAGVGIGLAASEPESGYELVVRF